MLDVVRQKVEIERCAANVRNPAAGPQSKVLDDATQEVPMSVVVRFPTSNMTRSQYDSVHDALEQSGNWPAPGCLSHICFGDEDNLRVSEVWESREQLAAFGETLGPHIQAAGIQMSGEPEMFDVVRFENFATD